MSRILQDAGHPVHIVIVQEAQQMGPGIHLVEMLVQGVVDLEEVGVVEAGPHALIGLIVGDAVRHFRIHDPSVISVDHFSYQEEFLFFAVDKAPELPEEEIRQAVGHIQTDPVYVKFPDPELHAFKNMLPDLRFAEVQAYQFVMALPALVAKSVLVFVVSIKVHSAEPVFVPGALPVFQQILKGPEAPSHMVEYSVQDQPDPVFMEGAGKLLQVLIASKTAVQPLKVPGIIAVPVRFPDGAEIESRNA